MDYQIPSARFHTENPAKDDPEWVKYMKQDCWWYSGNLLCPNNKLLHGELSETELERFRRLHKLLTSGGGYETCFPIIEEDMDKILSRGYFRKGTSKMMLGRPSQCHANSAELYSINKKDGKNVTLCTGYALSEDGLWRQHSWLLHRYNNGTQNRTRLVETTVKRIAYFGFELTEDEAEKFCDNNF